MTLENYPASLIDRDCDGNDRGDGDDYGKFPVHLYRPEDHGVGLEQIKGIQSFVENEIQNGRNADLDEIWPVFLVTVGDFHFIETFAQSDQM